MNDNAFHLMMDAFSAGLLLAFGVVSLTEGRWALGVVTFFGVLVCGGSALIRVRRS